ncbi:MAG: oxidoreductase, partial [Gemmatimonadetes bacterium]
MAMKRPLRSFGVLLGTAALAAASAAAGPWPRADLVLTPQPSGTDALLQAVSAVDTSLVWVSGHRGVVLRTTDGGATWTRLATPAGDSLQFRDVDAFDERTAALLSAGPGTLSRLYRTRDGGATWTLQFLMDHPDGFLDCAAFWDADTGFAYGDAVEGVLYVLRTDDGGRTWTRLGAGALPAAQPGEGGFAASGTCAATGPDGVGWIAAGNARRARVLRTDDYGRTWRAADAPLPGGAAAGA